MQSSEWNTHPIYRSGPCITGQRREVPRGGHHIVEGFTPSSSHLYPFSSLLSQADFILSPIELRERLQHLGLPIPDSTENLPAADSRLRRPHSARSSEPLTPPEYNTQLPSANPSSYPAKPPNGKDPLRRWPTVHDPLGPDDSISMYRPRQYGPTPRLNQESSIRTGRRGGTDVDYGERGVGLDDAFSADDGVTMNTPKSATYLEHTAAPGSAWTTE